MWFFGGGGLRYRDKFRCTLTHTFSLHGLNCECSVLREYTRALAHECKQARYRGQRQTNDYFAPSFLLLSRWDVALSKTLSKTDRSGQGRYMSLHFFFSKARKFAYVPSISSLLPAYYQFCSIILPLPSHKRAPCTSNRFVSHKGSLASWLISISRNLSIRIEQPASLCLLFRLIVLGAV